jgi:peptidoglycan/xylan/chitin deacetylase (PgdA/CDA1 family)
MKKIFYTALFLLSFLLVACSPLDSATNSSAQPFERLQTNISSDSATENPTSTATEPKIGDPWNEWVDISQIDAERKLVAFTFDDAPGCTLKKIMHVFSNYNKDNPDCPASATVFVNGIRVDAATRPTLQAASDFGFELGNHTYTHSDLTSLSVEQIRKEIDDVDETLYKIDGRKKHLVRAPYGKFDDKVKQNACAPLIDWSIDTEDWKGISADQIYDSILSTLHAGAIVLMHDGYPHTVEALERLLPDLKEKGYQIVNVSQLSKAWNCPFAEGNIYTHVKRRK